MKSCRLCYRKLNTRPMMKSIDKFVHTQGVGLYGSLGHGVDLIDSPTFQMIYKQRAEDQTIVAKQVSAGWGHSAGVTEDGDLFVWGRPYDFSNLMLLNKLTKFSTYVARFASRMTVEYASVTDGVYHHPHFLPSVGTVESVHCSAGLTGTY